MSKSITSHIEAYRTHNGLKVEMFLVINRTNRSWWWLPSAECSVHKIIEDLEDPRNGICLDSIPPFIPDDAVRLVVCDKTNEELYDILSDHFMYCEEDSWERNVDLELLEYEDRAEYYIKYIGE